MRKILALDVGGTAIKSGLFAADARILDEREVPSEAWKGGAALVERICGLIGEYRDYDAIGLSVTGQINADTGEVVYATDSIPGFTGTPLRRIVESRFGVPVSVDNDVNCAAIGEGHYGAARGYDDFLCLTYGTGIGGAVVRDRRVYRGAAHSAGEFGHMLTHAGGRPCACGNRGCYEAYASARALALRVREATGLEMDGREIFRAFRMNDGRIVPIVAEWMDEIVYGLVNLVHIFNPSCVIIGGGVMSQTFIVDQIGAKLDEMIMPNYRCVRVQAAELGNRAGMFGAYVNALQFVD